MTDINVGAITEALNDKTDRDLQNVDNTAGADAVIEYQMPTAENNYTWYRKYKSGWVEQGGLVTYDANPKTINFPVEMADTNYTGMAIQQRNANLGAVWTQINTKATTSFVVGGYFDQGNAGTADSSRNFNWRVEGMAAA